MTNHIPWPSIQTDSIKRIFKICNFKAYKGEPSVIQYKAKAKLHGTNSAVHRTPEGPICQSRKRICSPPNDDNCGFAAFIHQNADAWRGEDLLIFGEWCGPNVLHNTAIQLIPEMIFAVFVAHIPSQPDSLIVEPSMLRLMVPELPNVYVLPWIDAFAVDGADVGSRRAFAAHIEKQTQQCQDADPWVDATFGIRGPGEGLVYYPIEDQGGLSSFASLGFKAKTEHMREITKRGTE